MPAPAKKKPAARRKRMPPSGKPGPRGAWGEADREQAIEAILDDLLDGNGLRAATKPKGRPSKSLFLKWVSQDPALKSRYGLIMEARADALFEDALDIADSVPADRDSVSKARLRVDTRKWAAGKMNPAKYGDRIEHTGPGGGPIKTESPLDRIASQLARFAAPAAAGGSAEGSDG